MNLNSEFWDERYALGETAWDIGHVSTPLKAFFDQLENRDLRILIPGCGRAYEGEYLWNKGFRNVHMLDWSRPALDDFSSRVPDFPRTNLFYADFFAHQGPYDLVVEQTFFCALDPSLREDYARHVHRLLKPGGYLVGLLFDDPLNQDRPPFGGSSAEYQGIFSTLFNIEKLEPAANSIAPRAGRELFLLAQKPELP